MQERRYSRYKREDVALWLAESAQGVGVSYRSEIGLCVSLESAGKVYNAVILARSSDWYHYSLNAFRHGVTAVVAGTHDSCLQVPVLAMDTRRWYAPKKMRSEFGPLEPKLSADGKPFEDLWGEHRKTHYGHNMLIGALLCDREDAMKRLMTLPESTRLRIEAKIRMLRKRRRGRPLEVWP